MFKRLFIVLGQGVDTPLSETGLQQSEAVGRHLRDVPFSNVFVSNLQRAVQVKPTCCLKHVLFLWSQLYHCSTAPHDLPINLSVTGGPQSDPWLQSGTSA